MIFSRQFYFLSLFRISISSLWISFFTREPSENSPLLPCTFDPRRWRLYWTNPPGRPSFWSLFSLHIWTRGHFHSFQDCILVAQVSWVSESLTPGPLPSHMETSTPAASPPPAPRPPSPTSPNVYSQREEMLLVPSGRGTEGKLLPQEEESDSSAVFMWLFFFGGRR